MIQSIIKHFTFILLAVLLTHSYNSYSQYGTFWQESRNVKEYSFYEEYVSVIIQYNEGREPESAVGEIDSIAVLAFEEADFLQYLFMKNEAANLLFHNSNFNEAYDYLQDAMANFRSVNDTLNVEYVAALRLLRNLTVRLPEKENNAAEILQTQLNILEKIEIDGEPYRNTLVDYGLYLNRLGEKQKAVNVLYDARTNALNAGDHASLAISDYTIISNLPKIYDLQKTTLEVLKNDIKLFEEKGMSVQMLTYNSYFNYMIGSRNYFDLGDIEEGIFYTEKALACLDTLPYPSWNLVASCNAELALMYADKADTTNAWKHIYNARSVAEKYPMSDYNKSLAYVNIADAAVTFSADSAMVLIDSLQKQKGAQHFENKIMEVKAKALLKKNDADSAIDFIADIFDDHKIIEGEKIPLISDSIQLVDQLSFFDILEQAWRLSESVENENQRQQIIIALIMEQNKLYREIVAQDVYGFEVSSLAKRYHEFIMPAIEYVMTLENASEFESQVLELIFSSKSMQLSNYLLKARIQSDVESNSDLFAELLNTSANVQEVRNKLLNDKIDKNEEKDLRVKLNTLLVDNLMLRYDSYNENIDATETDIFKIPALAEVKQNLTGSKGILEFCIGDNYFVWALITENDVKTGIKYVDDFKSVLNKELYALKTGRNTTGLGTLLIEDIESEIAELDYLVIVPDKELNMIPFESFVLQNSGNLLIENTSVLYSYSTALWNVLYDNSNVHDSESVLAIAPLFLQDGIDYNVDSEYLSQYRGAETLSPLKYSEEEVLNIEKAFSNKGYKAFTLIGEDAIVENVKSNFNEFNILHFATHGISNSEYPERSGLFLYPAKNNGSPTLNDDSFFSMGELFNMNINAELVVLSACDTGKGVMAEGEGVMALPRGFILAGVPNVIASLWKVNDEKTKVLMTAFYSFLAEGKSYADALRLAKLECIDKGFLFLDWAGFVLIGV